MKKYKSMIDGNGRVVIPKIYRESIGVTNNSAVEVTLEEEGIVRFPDAPTERGIKHLEELVACKKAGYKAAVIFVVQMEGMRHFEPNYKTHPAFAEALKRAQAAGVEVLAYECCVTPDSLAIAKAIPVQL